MADRYLRTAEALEAAATVPPLPVDRPSVARIGGRAFRNFTHNLTKPFDGMLSEIMIGTAGEVMKRAGAQAAYTHGDEIVLVWDPQGERRTLFFSGDVAKMTSCLASMTTAVFHRRAGSGESPALQLATRERDPHFHAIVFPVPDRAAAVDYLLWRQGHAQGFARLAVCRFHVGKPHSFDGQNRFYQERLLEDLGVDFEIDYPATFRNGVFLRRQVEPKELTPEQLMRMSPNRRPPPGTTVNVAMPVRLDIPYLRLLANPDEVLFDGAEPRLR